jgi:hypothetical protein
MKVKVHNSYSSRRKLEISNQKRLDGQGILHVGGGVESFDGKIRRKETTRKT